MSNNSESENGSGERLWSFEPLANNEGRFNVALGPEMPLALLSREPSPAPPTNQSTVQSDTDWDVACARYNLPEPDGGKQAARQVTAKVCNEGVEPPSRGFLDRLHSSGEEDLVSAITISSDFTVDNCAKMLRRNLEANEAKRLLDKWIMVSRMEYKHFQGVPLGNLRQVLFESLQTASTCYNWHN